MRKVCVIWLGVALVFGSFFITLDGVDRIEAKINTVDEVTYAPHLPIRIDSNADFDQVHGVVNWATGNGSLGNPWMIENWEINGTGYGYCIYIGNTTEYFVVKNCYLHDANGVDSLPFFWDSGLILRALQKGTVLDNKVSTNSRCGIFLSFSNNIIIQNNSATPDNWMGIYSDSSNYCTITDNTVLNNLYGIYITLASHNHIANNTLSNNERGLDFQAFCSNNTIRGLDAKLIAPLEI